MNITKHHLRAAIAMSLLLAAAVFVVVFHGPGFREILDQGMQSIGSAGPAVFFLAMALLPAIGAPMAFFSLFAGSIFGPRLGMPLVAVLALGAVAANMAIGYFLASRVLRPVLMYLSSRLGYRIPEVPSGDATDLIVLLRVTPGVPFTMQNFLLGIAGVSFLRYQLVSCLAVFPIQGAFLVFGEALLQGRGRDTLFGLLLVVAALTAIHLVRRHYSTRNSSAA